MGFSDIVDFNGEGCFRRFFYYNQNSLYVKNFQHTESEQRWFNLFSSQDE